jgi:hypothetical protein
VAALAVGVNLLRLFVEDVGSSSWWVGVATLLVLAFVQWGLEASRRMTDDLRWQVAATTRDPVGYLAGAEYLDTLNRRQRRELTQWFKNTQGEVHYDDLPPVVRGFVDAVHPGHGGSR